MYLSCTEISVIWVYFTCFTISRSPGLCLQSYHVVYHIFLSLHDTYTINMYCDYAGSVYGTTPVCKQKSLHIHSYSSLN